MEDKKREEREQAVDDDDRDDAEDRASARESSKSAAQEPSSVALGDDEEEEEEEDEVPAPKERAVKERKKAAAEQQARGAAAHAPNAEMDPAAVRNGELRVGLMTATAGYLAFWGAWMIYSKSVTARLVNYYSHSAWLFMIAYALVTVAAFYFVRLETSARFPKAAGGKTAPESSKLRVDKTGVLLAAAVCGPLYAVYWYVAKSVLQAEYDKMWWLLELVAFVAITLGGWWGLRPPSIEDERRERWPTRRVLMLLMVPFLMVFGMIWLASAYPPWPS